MQCARPRSDEYKKEAVKLADTVGVTAAAKQLGIHTTQIYNWRGKLRVKETRTEAEIRLMEENARLTRELAEKKQENDFLKKASVSSTGQCNTFASINDNKVARNEKATRSHDTSRSQDYLARLACW